MEKWLEKKLEAENTVRRLNSDMPRRPGIYVFFRDGEDGLRYAYVGQAVNLLQRCAQHILGSESWCDRSIKKHGFYNHKENPYGYRLTFVECPQEELNEREHSMIVLWGTHGYQLRNKTSGGQDDSKEQINEYLPAKGYYDGLRQGWKNARVFVANLFDKNLVAMMSGKEGPRKAAALEKFKTFLAGECKQEKKKEECEDNG